MALYWQQAMNWPNRANQSELFLEWLRPIQRDLEIYCRRLIWNPHEVPDAIHNAMLRGVAHFDRCHGAEYFRAWMFKILTHEALALNRKHARIARFEFQVEAEEMDNLVGAEPGQPWGKPDELADWRENLEDHLDLALKSLTEPERAVLLLRAIGDFKYQEIAEELDLPIGSVMGYLARARKKMQAALRRKQNPTMEEL
jgi:RNA polymerase sigma-70 factor (ECF subfamily)